MTAHAPQQQNLARPAAGQQWTPRQAHLIAGLRAVVVLAGSMRPTKLRRATGRFVLELPVDNHRNVLDCWRDQVTALAEYYQLDRLPVRVMIDHTTPPAHAHHWPEPVELRIERDPLEFRGTGGLLHDLVKDYGDDELILVAGAPQLLLEPLSEIVDALAAVEGDVRLLADEQGAPGGLMLLRCGALRALPKVGFVDLKEQGLPLIAQEHRVMVVRRPGPSAVPVRTMGSYLDALRHYHRRLHGLPLEHGPLGEDWRSAFVVVEDGAVVNPSATLHDSVILEGAVVESSAVLVRTVVGPGGLVRSGDSIVDRLVTPMDPDRPQH